MCSSANKETDANTPVSMITMFGAVCMHMWCMEKGIHFALV